MKLSTTQENLAHGLSLVSRIASKNTNLPILQNVLLRNQEKVLQLATTNLEIAMSCTVRGKVDEEGEFTVPAKLLSDYVSLLPAGQVDLLVDGSNLIVRAAHAETKIHGVPATEFPVIPRVAEGSTFIIPLSTLEQSLGSVLFATAQTESRPELTGVFFSFHGETHGKGVVTLAATDSYRLGEASLPISDGSSEKPTNVIIPARTLMELVRMANIPRDLIDTPDRLSITVSENQIQFVVGNTELQSRIIEGNYPDYRQIIPNQFRTEAVIGRHEFISAIRAASLFAKTGLADLHLAFSPGKPVIITTADSQTGEHHAELEAQVTGMENNVVVNYRYLLDGLNAIDDEEVVFKLIDAANPCLLTPKSATEKYLYIVMPIRQ